MEESEESRGVKQEEASSEQEIWSWGAGAAAGHWQATGRAPPLTASPPYILAVYMFYTGGILLQTRVHRRTSALANAAMPASAQVVDIYVVEYVYECLILLCLFQSMWNRKTNLRFYPSS